MNVLTIDLEEWFHINNSTWKPIEEWPLLESRVVQNTNLILELLRKNKIKATFFVLGWIAEYYPELIKSITEDGHDIGYHSYYHRIPKLQSKSEFENDLTNGLKLLESMVGKKIEYYRAPNFSLKNKWMLDCLSANGIKVSSSIKNPMKHKGINLPLKPFILKRANHILIEMPLNTLYLIYLKFAYSGSGYFRILPKWMLYQLFKEEKYYMFYFHPNDFDTKLPWTKELGYSRNFMNSIGTGTTLTKLDGLTKKLKFINISEAIELLEIEKLQIVDY